MKAIVSFLVALLVIPIVFANDMSVSLSPTSQSVCPSSHVTYLLTVRNEGVTNRTTFNVGVSDAIKNWTTIAPNSFELNSGQSMQVSIFIQPYYTAQPQSLNITINTTSGEKTIPLNAKLNILNCRGVELNALPISVCDGSSIAGFVNIKNTGTNNDTFTLSSDQNWTSLENNSITIQSNQTYQMPLVFGKVPVGNNNVKITAQSTSYAKSSINIPVNLEKCFDVKLTSSIPEICSGQDTNIPIIIQNTGTKPGTYNIYTKDVLFKIDNKTISITPGENTTLNSTVSLPKSARSDQSYLVYVDGTVKTNYKQDVKVIPYDKCYSFTTALDKRDISVKRSENTFTSMLIKNNGKIPLDFNITSNTEWVDLSVNSIKLNADESKQIFVYVAPTYDVKDGSYVAKINVISNDQNKTETLNVLVSQNATTTKKPSVNETQPSNETGNPIIPSDSVSGVKNILKFIFSPILNILHKL